MTDLALRRIRWGSIRSGGHAYDPVIGSIGILQGPHVLFQPCGPGHSWPALYRADDPPIPLHFLSVSVAEVVKHHGRSHLNVCGNFGWWPNEQERRDAQYD